MAYLGNIIFAQGVVTGSGKIKVVKQWPIPSSMRVNSLQEVVADSSKIKPEQLMVYSYLYNLALLISCIHNNWMSKTSKVQIQDRVSSKQSWELSCRVVPLGLSFGEFVVAFEFCN